MDGSDGFRRIANLSNSGFLLLSDYWRGRYYTSKLIVNGVYDKFIGNSTAYPIFMDLYR